MRKILSTLLACTLFIAYPALESGEAQAQASFEGGVFESESIGLAYSQNDALSAPSTSTGSSARLILPIRFVSQLSEPAPIWWGGELTPYCVAAASIMVMSTFQVETWSLAAMFAVGQSGNVTGDPGIDPAGNAHLMRYFGGQGRVHSYWDRSTALNELVGRLNSGSPVVIFGQAGNHAMVAYGYEADWGGSVTAIYVADPLGFMGQVDTWSFMNLYDWFGTPFTAMGDDWKGSWTFVAYRESR